MKKVGSVRGFKDLLPKEYAKYKKIIDEAEKIGIGYGFLGMDVPMLEYSEVFHRMLGEESEIVCKETYTFLDKSENQVTLRPEFTAGMQRCFESNNLAYYLPLRVFMHGPLFRYERPQKGRYRQFHQINFEHIGCQDALSDVQMIKMAYDILDALKMTNMVTLQVNSLGQKECLRKYQRVLNEYFTKYYQDLSEDSQKRLKRNNPLRILDSKSSTDQKLILGAPNIKESYSVDSAKRFEKVQEYLLEYKIPYVVDSSLVRGLDYYLDTVFEFCSDKIGAKSAVLSGGRYNIRSSHIQQDIGAIGCAGGIERLVLLLEQTQNICDANMQDDMISIIPIDEKYDKEAIKIFKDLRIYQHLKVVIESSGTLKNRMKKANQTCSKYVILIGEDEVKEKKFTLKNLVSARQYFLSFDQLLKYLNNGESNDE